MFNPRLNPKCVYSFPSFIKAQETGHHTAVEEVITVRKEEAEHGLGNHRSTKEIGQMRETTSASLGWLCFNHARECKERSGNNFSS